MQAIRNMVQQALDPNGQKKKYYFLYTIIFLIVAFFVFSWFIFLGKTLIWSTDGWLQHYKALVYYAQYLRNIIRHLITDHQLIIPDWDFYIGEGNDIVNTLHYYVIGDPVALISVLIPTRFMKWFYSASCILRMYLAGIAFSALCFGTGKKNRMAVLAGAVSYSFSIWAIYCAARHPFFLNPLIYYPFVILGVEKILRKDKPLLFIIAVAVSAASNFYFFYMIVLLTVAYTLVRLIFLYHKMFRQGLFMALRLGAYAVIGVCITGILFVPMLFMFAQDSRGTVSQSFQWLYSLSYYSKLPSTILSMSTSSWFLLGITVPGVLAVILLFIQKKKNIFLKVLVIICGCIIAFPIGGRLMNGMSYAANRWSWAFILLCCYILVEEWDVLTALSKQYWKILMVASVVYYAACLCFEESRNIACLAVIPLMFITVIVLKNGVETAEGSKNGFLRIPGTCQTLILIIIIVNVVNNAFWKFSPGTDNYVARFKENNSTQRDLLVNEAQVIKYIAGSEYVRYSGNGISSNENMMNQISNTQYYWTNSNPYLNRFRMDMEVREPLFYSYQGYDDRTTLLALSAVRYFSNSNGGKIPYGYEQTAKVNNAKAWEYYENQLKEELGIEELSEAQSRKIRKEFPDTYTIYENQYALPLGYCYDSYFLKEAWDQLDPVAKQESLWEAAVIDQNIAGIEAAQLREEDYSIPYTMECRGSEITKTEHGFVTTSENTEIVIELDKTIPNSEVYIGFEGIEFTATPPYDLYFGGESVDPLNLYNKTNWELLSSSDKTSMRTKKLFWNSIKGTDLIVVSSEGANKKVSYSQPEEAFSSGRHDFIANMGYTEEPVSSITVTFSERGIYEFDSIKIYAVSMDNYPKKVQTLQQDSLENVTLGTDTVKGKIDLEKQKLLCVAIPYSPGWEAFIDDGKADAFCVNDHYIGLVVPEGKHSVELRYHNPYKKAGAVLSVIGIAVLIFLLINERRKMKVKNDNERQNQ